MAGARAMSSPGTPTPELAKQPWVEICDLGRLTPDCGVAARVGDRQVAIFYLPDANPTPYAIDNFDPIGDANVLARGIVGDIGGELVVASPLYKQHFSLATGCCLEDPAVRVAVYPVRLDGDRVLVGSPEG